MLDTNIVSGMMRKHGRGVTSRLREVGEGRACVSVITAAELRFGAARVGSANIMAHIERLLTRIPALPFSPPADTAYANIRAALERAGTPIGPNDLFIAAHALALDLTLVTANQAEFVRVPGLRVENWLD